MESDTHVRKYQNHGSYMRTWEALEIPFRLSPRLF